MNTRTGDDILSDMQTEVVQRAVEAIADLERFHIHVPLRLSVDLCRSIEGLHALLSENDKCES